MNAVLMPASCTPAPFEDAQRRQSAQQILRALASACDASPARAQQHGTTSRSMVKVEVTLPRDLAGLLGNLTIRTWEGTGPVTEYHAVPANEQSGLRLELRDAQGLGDLTPGRFCEAFDITHAEARVLAALVAGELPKRYASSRGLSIHTVRTQINSLKMKMGCNRQIDLVRKAFGLTHLAPSRPSFFPVS